MGVEGLVFMGLVWGFSSLEVYAFILYYTVLYYAILYYAIMKYLVRGGRRATHVGKQIVQCTVSWRAGRSNAAFAASIRMVR